MTDSALPENESGSESAEEKYDPRERWHYPDELRAMLDYAERLHVATIAAVQAGGRHLSASVRIEHAVTGEPFMWLHLLAENDGPVVTLYDPAGAATPAERPTGRDA